MKTSILIPENAKVATFAGGCFWCLQPSFDAEPGVLKTVVGYAGGRTENPTYEEVLTETTGHRESIHVFADLAKFAKVSPVVFCS